MRAINIGAVAVNLATEKVPFLPGYTVTVINATVTPHTLQSSNESGSGFTTLIIVPAGEARVVTVERQFVRLSAAGNLILIGN